MRLATRLLLAVAIVAGAACGDLLEPAAGVVGNSKITTDEVRNALERFAETSEFESLAEEGDPDDVRRRYEQVVLSRMIRREVLRSRAEDLGIEVTDEDVDEAVEELKTNFPSEQEFERAVAEQGLTSESLREVVRDSVFEERLRESVTRDVTADEPDVRAYYEENESEFTETRVAHILVSEDDLAREISSRLERAPERRVDDLFATLARRHSEDPGSADRGGDLGFAPPGSYVEAFEQAVADLDVGEISRPIRTEFGFHLIRVLDRRVQPFEQVRSDIEEQLSAERKEEAWQEWIVRAYREADIRVNPRYGELDLETQIVVDAGPGDVPGTEEPEPTPTPTQLDPLDQAQ